MTNRKISDFGVHPIIGYPLLAAVFVGLSIVLFHVTDLAHYIYVFIAFYFVSKPSDRKRNDFLEICFDAANLRRIRIVENLLIVFPFAMFLFYKSHSVLIPVLLLLSASAAFVNIKTSFNFVLPTPFHKRPFEFIVGFRKTFYVFITAYVLTGIAVAVNNFNLGVFALASVFFCLLSYYIKPENEYYVWIFGMKPGRFLFDKIKTAVLYASFLSGPVLLALSIFYIEHIGVLLLVMLLGYTYLITVVLVKYSSYPEDVEIFPAVVMCVGFLVPPALAVIIPFFADRAKTKLKEILP